MSSFVRRVMAVVVVVLAVLSASAPVPAKARGSETHELYLQRGERFTVVCAYKGAQMFYGDNGTPHTPPTGLMGVCD